MRDNHVRDVVPVLMQKKFRQAFEFMRVCRPGFYEVEKCFVGEVYLKASRFVTC